MTNKLVNSVTPDQSWDYITTMYLTITFLDGTIETDYFECHYVYTSELNNSP